MQSNILSITDNVDFLNVRKKIKTYKPNPSLYLFIFGSWIAALYWYHPRMLQLLEMETSYVDFISLWFFIIFVELAWLYGLFNVGVVLFAWIYKRFVKKTEIPVLSKDKPQPPVAILYTTYNDFVEKSALSCVQQNYDHYRVYILDDSTDEAYKKQIDAFASRYPEQVRVIRRKDRKGFKAGNMNHALNRFIAEPYFAIADADEILPRDFLLKMVPYLVNDPNCGFVQANHRANPDQKTDLARALGDGIDIHWRWYQPLRNKFGFVMFLGHGALLRRSCWKEIGGFPDIVSEDLGFAMRIRELGYYGRFAENVICYEDFPETIRAFRVRHIKWTRGTCEFLTKEAGWLLRSTRISWSEKFDILFPTLNLPLTLFYFLFMINANMIMPFLFGEFRDVTIVLGNWEFAMPIIALNKGFAPVFSWDFFAITMLTFFAPVLTFVIEMVRKPIHLFKFLAHSTVVYAALSPLSAIGVLSFLITGKATFLVTGDKKQQRSDSSKNKNTFRERLMLLLKKSHPDQKEVRYFEMLSGIVFLGLCIYLFQISFMGLALAFIIFPLMHNRGWGHARLRKLIYIPFIMILAGVGLGAAGAMGLQTVFFGFGFHF
ncbi:MAG: glycosyltransferase [Calditrichaeota bacterium]|nr:MAG: glycosyltransferase [Calditrichota bacterium]